MIAEKMKPSENLPLISQEASQISEGIYYFNARWYDAETGRFITEDPIKDSTLWFAYVSNNPLKFVDPTGLREARGTSLYDEEETRQADEKERIRKEKIEEGEKKKRDEIEETVERIKELEDQDKDLWTWLRISHNKSKLRGQLKVMGQTGSDKTKAWIRENTGIDVTRGHYGTPGEDNWDGKMELKFQGVSLLSIRVQTWADHPTLGDKDGTLRPGEYDGDLIDDADSASYKDVIRFFPNLFQTHASEFVDPSKIYGEQPMSKGCIIGQAADYFGFTGFMKDIGFAFGAGQSVRINIGLSQRHIPYNNPKQFYNHYTGTQGHEKTGDPSLFLGR